MTQRNTVVTPSDVMVERSRILLMIGAFFVFFPSGVFMYWGNLSVYVNSYIVRSAIGRDKTFPAPWIISSFLVCNNLGITSGRLLSSHMGRRQTALAAIFLFNSGLFVSSVAIRYSLAAMCLSFGLLTGLGSGLLYSSVIADVIDKSDIRVGLFTQTVTTGYNIGAVVTNEYITIYINPKNVDVDISIDSVSYFSSKSILDAIPKVFLILGGFTLMFQVIGVGLMHLCFCNQDQMREDAEVDAMELLLVQDNYDEIEEHDYDCERDMKYECDFYNTINDEEYTEDLQNYNLSPGESSENHTDENAFHCLVSRVSGQNIQHGHSSICRLDMVQTYTNWTKTDACQGKEHIVQKAILPHQTTDNLICHNITETQIYSPLELQTPHKSKCSNIHNVAQSKTPGRQKQEYDIKKKHKKTEVSPRKLFCHKAAYSILSVILAKHIAFNLLSNYYKTLGENYIHDDQFLATLGSLLSLMSIVVKPAIGLIVDKCGIRTPTILSLIALCINSAVYPATPRIDKWAFMASSLLFEVSICAVNACCSLGTLIVLGKKYFTTNYGLLASVTILLDILAPVFIQNVLLRYGWVALFSGASVAVMVSLITTVLFLP